jgi:hypothetical protein
MARQSVMIGAQPWPRSGTVKGEENQQMEGGLEIYESRRLKIDGDSYAPDDPDDGNGCNGRAPDRCQLGGHARDSGSIALEPTS